MNTTPTTRRSGMLLILAGTSISAASSFIVLLVAAPALGPEKYAAFSVYWASLFMVVAVLFGVQQEVTRVVASPKKELTHASPQHTDPSTVSLLTFALSIAAVLLGTIAASSPLWARRLFGVGGDSWGLPLAVAVAAYTLIAVTNGILAGTERWGAFSLLAVTDGVLRLAFVLIVLVAGLGNTALAWAVALAFPLSLAIVLFNNLRHVRRCSRVSGTFTSLSANTLRTLTASVASAILINGFPVFLSLFSRTDQATLGAVILAVTLTRAPILVPLTALQSMLLARLSKQSEGRGRTLTAVLVSLATLTTLVAAFVWVWAEPLIHRFFGEGFVLAPLTLTGLVVASGCLGLITATGAAALATAKHTSFAGGWILAALIALSVLALLPLPLEMRVVLALMIGPVAGSLWHITAFLSHLNSESLNRVSGSRSRRDGSL